jgi:RNA polymerase sigma-70 factor, ECF subfamily
LTGKVEGEARNDGFAREVEPFRRGLLAHCYRMLGSWDEAEDALQETYLRAWRAYGQLEQRDLLQNWLFRIATNTCLSTLDRRGRRAVPSGLGTPAPDGDALWIQPIADGAVVSSHDDPAEVVSSRDSVRLALIASLQHLPARQRAVLILRDVLAFPASEVAMMLNTSTVAVKSALQRARARLAEVAPAREELLEPDDPRARVLLEQYMVGFANADTDALEKALRTDAALEMIPSGTWFAGKAMCVPFLSRAVGVRGTWKMLPTTANGQPAAAAYLLGDDGRHHAYGIGVLATTAAGIARIFAFDEAGLVERFGFPVVV